VEPEPLDNTAPVATDKNSLQRISFIKNVPVFDNYTLDVHENPKVK
jgi:hypothetical protein